MRVDYHLLFSALYLLLGVLQIGWAFTQGQMERRTEMAVSLTLFAVTGIGAVFGYRFLIRAVDRGYSAAKSSLAAVLLLLGVSPTIYWLLNIVAVIGSNR